MIVVPFSSSAFRAVFRHNYRRHSGPSALVFCLQHVCLGGRGRGHGTARQGPSLRFRKWTAMVPPRPRRPHLPPPPLPPPSGCTLVSSCSCQESCEGGWTGLRAGVLACTWVRVCGRSCAPCDARLLAPSVFVKTKIVPRSAPTPGAGPTYQGRRTAEWSSREDENGRGELSSIAPPDLVPSGALSTATFFRWPRS